MSEVWNIRRCFQIISFFSMFIMFILLGTIALESREDIFDQNKQTNTYKIETYVPSSYIIRAEGNVRYILSGVSFLGVGLKREKTLKPNTSAQIKCDPGVYRLTITSTQEKESIIEKKIIDRSFYQISPILMYFLVILLATLFSLSDLNNYFLGKNSRYSSANISFLFFRISQFLFELNKSDLQVDRLNLEIELYEGAKIGSGNPQLEHKCNSNTTKYNKFAKGVFSTRDLSKKCSTNALACFNPSYLYYPIEFISNIITKKIYFSRSVQILNQVSSLKYKDEIEDNIESANKVIAFDSTYPNILFATIVSFFSFFGITLTKVPLLSFLIVKLLIAFYLTLNITMSIWILWVLHSNKKVRKR